MGMEKLKQVQIVKKPVRTISGVTPLTVVLKPRKCNHGTCVYCPGGDKVPQSYTNKSPAIMRALALNFDPYEQVKNRLNSLKKMNHPTDKIELIILGGTFMQYPKKYRDNFIKKCYDALNGLGSKNLGLTKDSEAQPKTSSISELKKALEEAKKINETSKHRCVAMCIENRPDNCSENEIRQMLSYGCTRVELGIQMPDDKIYEKINRGHSVKDVIEATRKLKNAGFKVGYHIMPSLPYSNRQKDLKLFRKIFSSEDFRPDQLKIYPCQIISDSPLAKIYKILGFQPYTEEQTRGLLKKMIQITPEYCRVMRIMREFPKEKLVMGLEKLDLRKDIESDFRKQKIKIQEIRMREIGFNKTFNSNNKIKLKILEYNASNGKEFFLEFVNDENVLFGLLRLRIFEEDENSLSRSGQLLKKYFNDKDSLGVGCEQLCETKVLRTLAFPDRKTNLPNSQRTGLRIRELEGGKVKNDKFNIKNTKASFGKNKTSMTKRAIIRELHIYGQAINLGEKSQDSQQHKGIGKLLMEKTEEIVKDEGIKKLSVISGIGVREYYRKLRYKLEGNYMVKHF